MFLYYLGKLVLRFIDFENSSKLNVFFIQKYLNFHILENNFNYFMFFGYYETQEIS